MISLKSLRQHPLRRPLAWGMLVLAALLSVGGDPLLEFLAYPLRLVAAALAADPLTAFGLPVQRVQTEITVGNDIRLAVTYACSGIEQLTALLFIGYFFALYLQRTLPRAVLQLLFLIPSVVLSNALRLLTVIIGALVYGEAALADGWHRTLGYAQTLIAILLFFLFGNLLKRIFQ